MNINSCGCDLFCKDGVTEKHIKCYSVSRIAIIALGAITALFGILIISGIPCLQGINALGGAFCIVGGLMVLAGIAMGSCKKVLKAKAELNRVKKEFDEGVRKSEEEIENLEAELNETAKQNEQIRELKREKAGIAREEKCKKIEEERNEIVTQYNQNKQKIKAELEELIEQNKSLLFADKGLPATAKSSVGCDQTKGDFAHSDF